MISFSYYSVTDSRYSECPLPPMFAANELLTDYIDFGLIAHHLCRSYLLFRQREIKKLTAESNK